MIATKPHYLLFCDGNYPANEHTAAAASRASTSTATQRWRFVLEDIESGNKFEASDRESGAPPDRTALMAVLRGLEALEQPSRVTLVTTSRYVFRGLQYGLSEWRENDYSWEHFGSVQPIRNADLWRRIDRTLAFHQVQCRWMSQEEHEPTALDASPPNEGESDSIASVLPSQLQHSANSTVECVANSTGVDSLSNPASLSDEENAASSKPSRDERKLEINATQAVGSDERMASQGGGSHVDEVKLSSDCRASSNTRSVTIASATRIFKDSGPGATAPASVVISEYLARNSEDGDTTVPELESKGPIARKTQATFVRLLFAPIAWGRTGWNYCWEAILGLDELAESYVRCFFLLDPRTRRKR